jgi:hypothetical protein
MLGFFIVVICKSITFPHMQLFTQPVSITITTATIEAARKFSQQVVGTVDYSDSNQNSLQRIANDHFISKIGEEAVKKAFELIGAAVHGPDYTIYGGKQKSWEHDLYIDGAGLAVKTQTSSNALKYGLSWTFQCSGYRNDPILRQPLAWVCFVKCADKGDFACVVFPPKQIKDLPLTDPVLTHLKGKKKVVYAEDMSDPYFASEPGTPAGLRVKPVMNQSNLR